ncbi:MAG: hypothetical protein H0V12_10750 [Chloroflexi bacterium]|nr:hypothetical protein [Chloroflexota bacterium]
MHSDRTRRLLSFSVLLVAALASLATSRGPTVISAWYEGEVWLTPETPTASQEVTLLLEPAAVDPGAHAVADLTLHGPPAPGGVTVTVVDLGARRVTLASATSNLVSFQPALKRCAPTEQCELRHRVEFSMEGTPSAATRIPWKLSVTISYQSSLYGDGAIALLGEPLGHEPWPTAVLTGMLAGVLLLLLAARYVARGRAVVPALGSRHLAARVAIRVTGWTVPRVGQRVVSFSQLALVLLLVLAGVFVARGGDGSALRSGASSLGLLLAAAAATHAMALAAWFRGRGAPLVVTSVAAPAALVIPFMWWLAFLPMGQAVPVVSVIFLASALGALGALGAFAPPEDGLERQDEVLGALLLITHVPLLFLVAGAGVLSVASIAMLLPVAIGSALISIGLIVGLWRWFQGRSRTLVLVDLLLAWPAVRILDLLTGGDALVDFGVAGALVGVLPVVAIITGLVASLVPPREEARTEKSMVRGGAHTGRSAGESPPSSGLTARRDR